MKIPSAIVDKLAPAGKIRASINMGNPILTNIDPVTGKPGGVSIDLANNFAKLLGVDIELFYFDSAGKSVDFVTQDKADFGFFAIDPIRGQGISFTDPYVIIEGAYMVHLNSPINSNDEIDAKGNRIVVGKGSAYDLYLTREIKNADLVRSPTSPKVVEMFLEGSFEVAAGVRQQLEVDSKNLQNVKILPGRFMEIKQAMGIPKTKGAECTNILSSYVEEMKKIGFVENALKKHKITGAIVAPLA
jgi:polar amino acid transport system substrate-binding protein